LDLKKIVSILLVMAIVGVFMGSMQPASAVTTEIKVNSDNTTTEISIPKGKTHMTNELHASLHVDGGNAQWYRYITLIIRNSEGKLVYRDDQCTWAFGQAVFGGYAAKLDVGDYTMKFIYWGSDDGEWPKAKKIVKLHIIE